MGAVIAIIITALLILVMSVFLFCGKCSWLIAGYNTASAQEKDTYDKKKLCRTAGILFFVVFLFLSGLAFLGYKVETGVMQENDMLPFVTVSVIVLIISIVLAIWYMNTRCKR